MIYSKLGSSRACQQHSGCRESGSGKSCLTHFVIDHIGKSIQSTRNHPMAFFYCNNTDQLAGAEMNHVDKIMTNLLKQLAIEQNCVCAEVKQKYDEMHNNSHLTAVECVDINIGMFSQTRILYVIIDALTNLRSVFR
jgi:lipopolysaccharide biosynthesis regulator YciM